MSDQGKKNHTLIVAICISFVCGFLAGAGFAIYKTPTPAVTSSLQATNGISKEQAAAISDLEAQTVGTPDNFQLWIQLGNAYYDTNQPEKAIKAYSRSLELHAGDANLFTDLGMMYRGAGQPEKAIELFDRAIASDPRHEPSRINKGVVLLEDLHQPGKAIATWEELLSIDPDARTANGDYIRDYIHEVKNKEAP